MKGFIAVMAASLLFAIQTPAKTSGRDVYLDIIQTCVDAYTPERIADYVERVDREGIKEHGFARLASNIGILLANGRALDRKDLFIKMMDLCVRDIPKPVAVNSKVSPGNDFTVKEVSCCLYELERSENCIPKSKVEYWKKALTRMRAEDIYTEQPSIPTDKAYNWSVYGSASECARIMAGIGGDRAYADRYFADQLKYFDKNGMFKDPNQPMVYDIVTRLQFMAALDFGYDGPSKSAIEEQLLKSAFHTLEMQSVTGEIPYGGRSNQFLHNDTFYAAVFEYYASWMKRRGNMEAASRFKAAAVRALMSLKYWTGQEPIRHIKNRYPTETGYGCEAYAYFDKYMVTTGSWCYLAWRFADDSIVPSTTPEPASIFEMSDEFHRIVANAGGYTIQFDTDAQEIYESNGLGRLQKAGAPPVLALASPCPSTDGQKFNLDIKNPGPLAIAPLWDRYELIGKNVSNASNQSAELVFTDGKGSKWNCSISDKGLRMKLKQRGSKPVITIPVLIFDGESHTGVHQGNKMLEVTYRGWCCRYTTNGDFVDTETVHANRNGHLRRFEARTGRGSTLTVDCVIFKL